MVLLRTISFRVPHSFFKAEEISFLPLDSGALADVTTTIPVYVFKNLTKGSASGLGISSATAFIQSVVGCILVIIVNKVVDKISSGESALF